MYRVVRRVRLHERGVQRTTRSAVGQRVPVLEQQRLVARHPREPVPDVVGIVEGMHGLAGSVVFEGRLRALRRLAPGSLHALRVDGAAIAHGERPLLERCIHRTPDVDDGESALQTLLGLLPEPVAHPLNGRFRRVVGVGRRHRVAREVLRTVFRV